VRSSAMTRRKPRHGCPRPVPGHSTRSAGKTGTRSRPKADRWDRSLRDDSRPTSPAGLNLRGRVVRDGLHPILHVSDPALWPRGRPERGRDRHAGRRALIARGVPVDPCRRSDGPVRNPPGNLVLRLGGDGAGADLSTGAVVLAVAAVADRQWRGIKLCLVRLADLDRSAGRRRGRVYRPLQLLCALWLDLGADYRRHGMGLGRCLARLYAGCGLGCGIDDRTLARP